LDRRAFLGISGASAAMLTLDDQTPSLHTLLGSLISGGSTDTGSSTIDINLTGTYMEEYETGVPWTLVSGINGIDIPYLAKDGTAQIISMPVNLNDRTLYRMYPSDSLSGWSLERVPVVSQGFMPPTQFKMTVISGDVDMLMLYTPFSVYYSALAPSGDITRLSTTPGGTLPLTTMQTPPGVRYSLEVVSTLARNFGGAWPSGPQLRDGRNPVSVSKVDPAFGSLPRAAAAGHICYPLRVDRDDEYRAILLGQGDTVLSILLVRGSDGIFNIREQAVIGHSSDGRIFVNEPTPGQVEVLFFNLPTVQSVGLTYTPGSGQAAIVKAPVTSTIPAWNIPGLTVTGVYAAANPVANTMELRIAVKPLPEPPSMQERLNDSLEDILDRGFLPLRLPPSPLPSSSLPPQPASADYQDLWFTARNGKGQWSPLAPAATTSIALGGYIDGRFAINRRYSGYEIWRLDASLDYEVERVFLDLPGAKRRSSQAFRLGISLSQSGMALGGESMTMRASDYAHCTISGKLHTLRPRTSTSVNTDGTGTLWISLSGEDGMSFPVLYLSSPRFGKTLAIDLNQRMRAKITAISSASQLRQAKDPRDGKPILPDAANAEDLSAAMSQVLAHAPVPTAPGAPPDGVTVTVFNGIAVGWVTAVTAMAAGMALPRLTQKKAVSAVEPWIFSSVGGRPTFKRITPQDAAHQIEAVMRETDTSGDTQVRALSSHDITAAISCNMFGWDPCQTVTDVVETVVDGVSGAVKIIYNGAKLVVEYTVNGLRRLYEGALEVWEDIKNALIFILDAAGMLWGKLLRALLEFFFDWDAILRKRDEIKAALRVGAMKFTTAFQDPKLSVAGFKSSLNSMSTALNSYRSNSTNKKDIDGRARQTTPIASMFPSFGSECTWLLEKLQDVLPNFGGGLTSINFGQLAKLEMQVAAKMAAVAAALAPSINDLTDAVFRIVGSNFDPANLLDTVLDVLISKLTAIIVALSDLIDLGGDVLHELWANPGAVVDWFDTPLDIPGLRTFYEELFSNKLSLLDFVCAVAAVGISAVGALTGSSSAKRQIRAFGTMTPPLQPGALNETAVNDFAIAFLAIGILTTAVDTGLTAGTVEGSQLSTGLNALVSVGAAALALAEDNNLKYDLGACAAAVFVGMLFARVSDDERRTLINTALAVLMIFHWVFVGIDSEKQSGRGTAYSVLSAVQLLGSLAIRGYKGALTGQSTRKIKGKPLIGVVAWQTGLSVGKLLTVVVP
jgi:hypothetical protein